MSKTELKKKILTEVLDIYHIVRYLAFLSDVHVVVKTPLELSVNRERFSVLFSIVLILDHKNLIAYFPQSTVVTLPPTSSPFSHHFLQVMCNLTPFDQ